MSRVGGAFLSAVVWMLWSTGRTPVREPFLVGEVRDNLCIPETKRYHRDRRHIDVLPRGRIPRMPDQCAPN
jgi:hypothetical protein